MKQSKAKQGEEGDELDSIVVAVNKSLGDGLLLRGLQGIRTDVEVIPSGALSLDLSLGVGGFPRGRVSEIFGAESSGKTTLALHVIANAQKAGGIAAFVDVEHALDVKYAQSLGVNFNRLLFSQPDSGDQAMQLIEALIKTERVDVIVLDSVAALASTAELSGEIGDSRIAETARLMSSSLRKITGVIGKSKTVAIFINQLRSKIGMTFGNPDTTPGGRALKYYATVRVELKSIGKISSEAHGVTGDRIRARIVKNKVAPPFKTAEYEIIFGKGINNVGCLISLGEKYKLVTKSGSFLSYRDLKLGNGMKQASAFLEQNADIAAELRTAILQKTSDVPVDESVEGE